jgi:hypothetical protein
MKMGATHEQATLMLQLYEMRREPRLRQARQWFMERFSAATPEEMMQKYPPGSEENTNVRMVASYWDMCAGIVNRGLVDDELYFESNGEAWGVWEKMKHIVPPMRAAFKNPRLFGHLEELCKRFEAWREKVAPGSNEAMRQRMAQMAQAAAQAKAAR